VQRPGIGTEGALGLCELYHAARAHRSLALGKLIVTAIQAGGAFARQAVARYRQYEQAWAMNEALGRLDDRTLRDLGISRGEIASLVAEVTGQAECTRVRVPAPVRP
jgi:uncharacterized protein YjiS (DUF1127 family)